jgi:hypothetical protein
VEEQQQQYSLHSNGYGYAYGQKRR